MDNPALADPTAINQAAAIPAITRRTLVVGGLSAGSLAFLAGSAPGVARAGEAAGEAAGLCGLDLSRAAFRSAADWDAAFVARWGPLGAQSRSQIDTMIHAANGVYDDTDGPLAWIAHYWVRAWLAMAELTGEPRYMDAAASVVEFMLEHTDERRVARGEIVEDYVRDPLYLRGSGAGGPFWKRGGSATVLDTGQVAQAILRFAAAVQADERRWRPYAERAARAFVEARRAVDAFDNDWQVTGDTGSYHYRDSGGSGELGVTRVAFNQAATMMTCQILINARQPSEARADKIRRLVRTWLDDYATFHADGTVTWPYIRHPTLETIEDVGHASVDLDFLVAAYESGLTALERRHVAALARTFLVRVCDGEGRLNANVDGSGGTGHGEHWNAAIGWLGLGRYDPRITSAALAVYNRHYPPAAPDGVLWARPMLGWAALLCAGRPCAVAAR